MLILFVNLLLAFLAFFVTRWIGSMVAPEGQDKDKVVTVVAVVVAILVFLSAPAATLI